MMRKFLKFRSRRKQWSNVNETFAFLIFPIREMLTDIAESPSYTSGVNVGSFNFIALNKTGAAVGAKYQLQINNHFERMLAKIALGLAIGKYSVGAFAKIYIRDIILSTANNIGRWVGTDILKMLPIKSNTIHTVGVFEHSSEITVRVRVFLCLKNRLSIS